MRHMKKILMIIVAVVLGSLAANAQISSDIYRKGKDLCISGERLSPEMVISMIGSDNYYDTYVGARKQYKSGLGLTIAGATTIGFGILVGAVGLAGLDGDIYTCGIAMDALGAMMLDAGIPLLIIGKKRLNWCADDYNRSKNGYPAVTLNVGAQRYGTGISLRF